MQFVYQQPQQEYASSSDNLKTTLGQQQQQQQLRLPTINETSLSSSSAVAQRQQQTQTQLLPTQVPKRMPSRTSSSTSSSSSYSLEPIPVDTQTMKIVDNVSNKAIPQLARGDMQFAMFCLSPLVDHAGDHPSSSSSTATTRMGMSSSGDISTQDESMREEDDLSSTGFDDSDFEPSDFHDSSTSLSIDEGADGVVSANNNNNSNSNSDDMMVEMNESMIQFSKDFQPATVASHNDMMQFMQQQQRQQQAAANHQQSRTMTALGGHQLPSRMSMGGGGAAAAAAVPRFHSIGENSNCSWIDSNIRSSSTASNISEVSPPKLKSAASTLLYDMSSVSAACSSHGKSSDDWVKRFQELCLYKEKYGTCAVPHDWKGNRALANWVKRQRYQYSLKKSGKHSTLTDARQEALRKIGFRWKLHKAMWNERFAELKEFRDQNGHCNVPSRYPQNSSLAVWVQSQRRQYKLFMKNKSSSHMTRERIERLEAIGFEWNGREAAKKSTA